MAQRGVEMDTIDFCGVDVWISEPFQRQVTRPCHLCRVYACCRHDVFDMQCSDRGEVWSHSPKAPQFVSRHAEHHTQVVGVSGVRPGEGLYDFSAAPQVWTASQWRLLWLVVQGDIPREYSWDILNYVASREFWQLLPC